MASILRLLQILLHALFPDSPKIAPTERNPEQPEDYSPKPAHHRLDKHSGRGVSQCKPRGKTKQVTKRLRATAGA
eukprot:scaffold2917_cov191-Amphora_coffeaeformis.AAC.33